VVEKESFAKEFEKINTLKKEKDHQWQEALSAMSKRDVTMQKMQDAHQESK
jgi:hypothetical protein